VVTPASATIVPQLFKTDATTFVHDSEFPLNIAGSSDSSRIFHIDTMGVFENHAEINIGVMNVDSSFVIQGAFNNLAGATFNLLTGNVLVGETGTFTNDWVVAMLDPGSQLYVLGSAVNNGFYNYTSGAAFADGTGTVEDNGLPFVSTLDANGSCTVDLANISLEWFEGENSIGTSDETGALTFAEASLHDNPTSLSTIINGVSVTVENYCPEAWIDPSSIFDLNKQDVLLKVYPTIVDRNVLTIDLSEMENIQHELNIVDLSGRSMSSVVKNGKQIHRVNVSDLQEGVYFIQLKGTGQSARFIIAR